MGDGMKLGGLPYLFYKNASELIHGYDGSIPFHLYLKEKYRENKNWGSKDRKRYRACCYHFWRNAYGVSRDNAADILTYLQTHYPAENQTAEQHPNILPYQAFENLLSQDLSPQTLQPWFQTEPVVWIRAIQGKESQVLKALAMQQIEPLALDGPTMAVSAQADLQTITTKGIAYIQDIGSQRAMDWRNLALSALCTSDHKILDCCAGSGGKSITLLQNHPKAQIHCTDVRRNILENLQKRFQSLQLLAPKTQVLNLAEETPSQPFHIVVADVPCSGSGTWRRNPENLHFFTLPEISLYAQKQQQILQNLAGAVVAGGYLVYLTCSVFRAENEDNVAQFLERHPQYHCIEQQFCGGKEHNGDYIYRAVLQKVG
ncbi:MAG: hypothetical protein ACKOXR_06400 [Bacteroidota bacterium]